MNFKLCKAHMIFDMLPKVTHENYKKKLLKELKQLCLDLNMSDYELKEKALEEVKKYETK